MTPLLRTRRLLAAAMFAVTAWAAAPAGAVNPDEMLDDPVLEERARDISAGLRCLVCQNESIDDSNADLARDLRLIVRERLVKGDSDGEVIQYVVDRYGDYVLLKPPFKAATYILWFGPLVFVVIAVLAGRAYFRRQKSVPATATAAPAKLSPEEERRLAALLEESDKS